MREKNQLKKFSIDSKPFQEQLIYQEGIGTIIKSKDSLKMISHTGQGIPYHHFSSSYQPYIPAQMAPRPPLKCAYCKQEGHSATRCTHLAEDLDKRLIRTQRASYLCPNYQRVPME
ncbi:hypothetical protein O181_060720 [Austropuccinia psidii MF-1]|uniref:CCHC-type domain-containing protein n=1 Tax=Austropuccinia psidii MF-1 TaxID=1389203 RepID=A0A9Q3HZV0_9BASI|nr:hypothetical protein [Austropuccinia psidii MF-1]